LPARLSKEERLQRLVDKTRLRIEQTPASATLLRHMPNSMLGVLARQAGFERASSRFLEDLSNRLRDEGIEFSPELVDPANTHTTRIYFFDSASRVKGLQPTRELFKDETELSRFLWLNKDFLKYATKNLRVTHQEKRLTPGAKIDLLAIDTKTRELVGIELKAKEPDQGIVAQAAKYMKALKALAEAEGHRGARLVIITGQPDAELAELVQNQADKIGVPTDWLLYRVKFELRPA